MARAYGQHFLSNKHAVDRIIDALQITPADVVLEIGPGKGVLTAGLLKAKTVAVVEVDPVMIQKLQDRFGFAPYVKVFHADILEFDFSELDKFAPPNGKTKVVGNLPYNLTSPILRRLSDWSGWDNAHVMVQREVADRLCAKVGTPEYGALTAGMSLTCAAEFVFELSANSFTPPPRVTSAVVKLTRLPTPLTDDTKSAQRVIQAAFQQRRKTLLNSLSHGLGLEKETVKKGLAELGIDDNLRAERISVDDFVRISRLWAAPAASRTARPA